MFPTLIQLFARPPLAGRVKTRLIPDVGVQSATAIYRHCLQHNLQLVQQTDFDVQIWLTDPSSDTIFNHQPISIQQGKHLGQRMYYALADALQNGYQKVILIGSDCLELSPAILQRVCAKLDQHDLVFIPALDGGYVLVAARHSIDCRLFEGIDWGSAQVLIQTLEAAMRCGINTALLNPLRDIDTADDLQHYAELKQYLPK
ncbi:MAG: TIGR04282 family arsenosugar biosynthesis glycosyltransferase [Gammaproteobacteria bacterium]|nr:TIGR04282 family arsenosugar biosynthesis glycosyltransferase [Gammaproteobacteria bacterium]